MTEDMKDFVAKGYRRMAVAMYAVTTVGIVHVVAEKGINEAAAYGIAAITIGYYSSKFAEAVKSFFESRKV